MDSSNMLDLHYPHDELHLHPSPLCWIQNPLLNGDEQIEGSSDGQHIDPCFASEMVQDLGFHWTGHGSAQQLHLAKIKHEQLTLLHELNSYHLLPPFANGSFGFDPLSSGMFPQALDQISRTGSCQIPSIYQSPVLDSFDYGVQRHLEGSSHVRSSISLHEMHPSVNGVAEYKRANGSLDRPKASKKARFEHGHSLSPFKVRKEKLGDRIAALQQLVAPFGKNCYDRNASQHSTSSSKTLYFEGMEDAYHASHIDTDTASVLMESIGYIKFLQEQVETLSVPYMRSKSDKKLHTTEEVSSEEIDEAKMDLKSRGLCLVPLSCTSYVTNDHTAWPPPNLL